MRIVNLKIILIFYLKDYFIEDNLVLKKKGNNIVISKIQIIVYFKNLKETFRVSKNQNLLKEVVGTYLDTHFISKIVDKKTFLETLYNKKNLQENFNYYLNTIKGLFKIADFLDLLYKVNILHIDTDIEGKEIN